MARLARVIAVDVPHHVTQGGNARQFILTSDAERLVYLDLLRNNAALHQLSLIGYCLMSNHVHLIVIPRKADSLALTLKHTHGRYAKYWNVRHASSGHVWQDKPGTDGTLSLYSAPQPRTYKMPRFNVL